MLQASCLVAHADYDTTAVEDSAYTSEVVHLIYNTVTDAATDFVAGAVSTTPAGALGGAATANVMSSLWEWMWNEATESPYDTSPIKQALGESGTVSMPVAIGKYVVNGELGTARFSHLMIYSINGNTVDNTFWQETNLIDIPMMITSHGIFGVRRDMLNTYAVPYLGSRSNQALFFFSINGGSSSSPWQYTAYCPDIFENSSTYQMIKSNQSNNNQTYPMCCGMTLSASEYPTWDLNDYTKYMTGNSNTVMLAKAAYYNDMLTFPMSGASPAAGLAMIYDYLDENFPEYEYTKIYPEDVIPEEETTDSDEYPLIDTLEFPDLPNLETFPVIEFPERDQAVVLKLGHGMGRWWYYFGSVADKFKVTWIIGVLLVISLAHFLLRHK